MAKYKITSIPQARYGGVFKYRPQKIMKGQRTNNVTEDQEEPIVEVQDIEQPSYWNQMQSPVMQGKQCPPGKYNYNGECLTEAEYIAVSNEEQRLAEEKLNQIRNNINLDLEKLREKNKRQSQTLYENDLNRYFETFDASKKSDKIEPFESVPAYNVSTAQLAELKKQFLVNKTENGYYELYPLNIAYDRIVNNGFQADQFKNYWGLDPKQVKDQLQPLMTAAKEQYDATVTNKIIDQAVREGKTVSEVVKSLPSSLGNQKALKQFIKPAQDQINKAFDYAMKQYSEGLALDSQASIGKASKDQSVFFSNDPQAAWERKYHGNDMMYQANKMERGQKAFDNWMTNYASTPNEDIRYSQDDQMAMQRNANQRSIDNVTLSTASNKRNIAENEDFNKAYLEFLGNFSAPDRNKIFMQALTELNENERGKYLGMLDTDPNAAMQSLLGKTMPNSKKTYQDLLSESVDNSAYHAVTNTLKEGKPSKELTTGDKVLDVLKHPFDATYFAMHPGETMWDNKTGTYRQRVKDEDKFGFDLGTMPDYSPMWAMNQSVNVFNPFKIGMNLREGYDEGDFVGALGKELWDIGTAYGGMRGLGAVSKIGQKLPVNALQAGSRAAFSSAALKNAVTSGAKNLLKNTGTIASNIFSNPLVDAGVLLSLDQNVENATKAFNKGDYKTAAMEAGVVGLSALPAYRYLKGAKRIPNPTYYDFNPMFQPTQNILNSKGLLGYKEGGASGCPPGYAKVKGKCKKVEPFVTSDPVEYAKRKAAYDDSLFLHDQSVKDYNYANSLRRPSIFKPKTNDKFFEARRRLNHPDFLKTGVITNSAFPTGKAYGIYAKPKQPIVFKPKPSKPKPPIIKESIPPTPIPEQVIPTPIPVPPSLPPVPPIPGPPPGTGTDVMPVYNIDETPMYATPDPDGEWISQTKRYIDWDGNSIGYNLPRFRKPGHGGDLIKKGKRHYLHYPSIETRNSAYIQREDEEYENGGVVMKLSKKEIEQYIKDGYIIEDE
jgi:hypothetical protein